MHAGELISDAVRAVIGEGFVPTGALVVVAGIDGDGAPRLWSFDDDDTSFYAKEGMARSLLRDVLAVPIAAETEQAYRALHSDNEDD